VSAARRAFLVIFAVGLVMAVLVFVYIRRTQVVGVGGKLPNIVLPTVSGQAIALTTLHGRPMILDFFTTWCGPCQVEASLFQRLATETKGQVAIVLIDKGEPVQRVKQFIQKYQLNQVIVLMDVKDQWAVHLGVTGQPETFLVNAQGTISKHVPYEMTYNQLREMAGFSLK